MHQSIKLTTGTMRQPPKVSESFIANADSAVSQLGQQCAVKGAGLQWVHLPPGNWFAPPGSNRSGGEGNQTVGAFSALRKNLERCSSVAHFEKLIIEAPARPRGHFRPKWAKSRTWLWKWRAVETVEKSNPDFSTVSTALGNPATDAGFPHFPSHDGGWYPLPLKANPAKIAGPVRFLRRAAFSV